jgi:hypothetical protein
LSPPPGAPSSLLIVEAHRGHVAKDDSLETPNVDADFHCCRHAEDIDLVNALYEWMLVVRVYLYNYVAEEALPFRLIV